MRLAAIDIGSNATRILIVEAKHTHFRPEFIKLNFLRIGLRLGFDVFPNGNIGREKRTKLIHVMRAFSALLSVYKVDAFLAYATSAMRNAKNSSSILKEIKEKTGIKVKIITGPEEAELLYEIHAAEKLAKKKTYLYLNVGGGSTEFSLFIKGKQHKNLSFEIGTIRILNNLIKKSQWDELKIKLKALIKSHKPTAIIGTGGNINKIFSMSRRKNMEPITIDLLKSYYQQMKPMKVIERMKKYKFNYDRADVIVPALSIYISVMKWSKVNVIYVPKMGLVDGIIYSLYKKMIKKH